MVKAKSKTIIIIVVVFILILSLWVSGIIPQQIGKIFAIIYVQRNHQDVELIFDRMDFSQAHGAYFAVFKDTDGDVYNFLMDSKLLPVTIMYDPIQGKSVH